MEGKLCAVQGGEVIHGGLRPADQLEGAVLAEQHLSGAEFAVAVAAHGVTVGAGVMDDNDIAPLNGGQATLRKMYFYVRLFEFYTILSGLSTNNPRPERFLEK